MNDVVQAIATVGYPIVCSLLSFAYIYKISDDYRKDYNALHEKHKEEVLALTAAIENQKEVIRSLEMEIEERSNDK